ncbi:unnamed protein product [Lepeophtheirus salmonis]|uniref:(salmon louse) hypothetical protein n=1 Tax=Lepeophtheirus salmonis TaxID=72036 RepID=A0A7R8CRA7_LEPSM|nr:unnamed protein product [Lepeophtheirus salmonis]CAF2852904.1 unnamed protein product [Lepeophtheirus salmonis]
MPGVQILGRFETSLRGGDSPTIDRRILHKGCCGDTHGHGVKKERRSITREYPGGLESSSDESWNNNRQPDLILSSHKKARSHSMGWNSGTERHSGSSRRSNSTAAVLVSERLFSSPTKATTAKVRAERSASDGRGMQAIIESYSSNSLPRRVEITYDNSDGTEKRDSEEDEEEEDEEEEFLGSAGGRWKKEESDYSTSVSLLVHLSKPLVKSLLPLQERIMVISVGEDRRKKEVNPPLQTLLHVLPSNIISPLQNYQEPNLFQKVTSVNEKNNGYAFGSSTSRFDNESHNNSLKKKRLMGGGDYTSSESGGGYYSKHLFRTRSDSSGVSSRNSDSKNSVTQAWLQFKEDIESAMSRKPRQSGGFYKNLEELVSFKKKVSRNPSHFSTKSSQVRRFLAFIKLVSYICISIQKCFVTCNCLL